MPFRTFHPNANTVFADLTGHVELRKRGNYPSLKVVHEPAHVASASRHIKHHIDNSLSRSVIRELAAAPGLKDWKPVVYEIFMLCGCTSSVKGRMLQEPDTFFCLAVGNRLGPRLHPCLCLAVIRQAGRSDPCSHAASATV